MQCGAIEVWTAQPGSVGPRACGELAALLDEHERERVSLLRFEADRDAFVVAHALRRMALASALGTDPAQLRFAAGPQGRPLLLDAGDQPPVFSLTRSRGFVACAVARQGQIGIDVEKVRSGVEASVIEQFVRRRPGADETDFFVQWTALEAFWKARGLGLSSSNPRISLLPLDGEHCHAVIDGETGNELGIVVLQLPAPPGHVLTLACSEPADIRIVELESLAPPPAPDATELLSRCRQRSTEDAAAIGTANS